MRCKGFDGARPLNGRNGRCSAEARQVPSRGCAGGGVTRQVQWWLRVTAAPVTTSPPSRVRFSSPLNAGVRSNTHRLWLHAALGMMLSTNHQPNHTRSTGGDPQRTLAARAEPWMAHAKWHAIVLTARALLRPSALSAAPATVGAQGRRTGKRPPGVFSERSRQSDRLRDKGAVTIGPRHGGSSGQERA